MNKLSTQGSDKTHKPDYPFSFAEYRKKAVQAGIDPTLPELPKASLTEFRGHRGKNIRLYAYTNRIATQLLELMKDSPAALAVFDPDGYLLKLFGTDKVLSNLSNSGIEKGTVWSLDKLGPNAVSVGLAERKTLSSVGEENYCDALKQFAIYFSPVIVTDDYASNYTLRMYGGLAIFVPVEYQNDDYRLTVYAAANDLMLHINVGDTYYRIYQHNADALLFFDINMKSKKVSTIYHSENIFRLFGIKPIDMYFRPAENLIDPLPKNQVFWSILTEQKRLHNYSLTLTVQGKEIQCVVTTEPYYQPTLNASGIIFMITTPQSTSSYISKKMGNGAIISFDSIIGQSSAFMASVQKAKLIANIDSNVMLLGESGVGKDIFAQAIHKSGPKSNRPFIAVNCGALPRDLIASELFGYEGGAFTGAKRQGNIGKFELANGGTIFLDEIGELPLDLQATLLRVVEQKQFMRLGGNTLINVDVKIISATNANMQTMIEQKRFREDLYYRLSTMKINIPPLRARGEDIILLAEYFIRSISSRIGKTEIQTLSDEAKELLKRLPWRGNVRELQNLIDGIVQLYPDSVIEPRHILADTNAQDIKYEQPKPSLTISAKSVKRELTAEEILAALEACHGNRSAAAHYLGIARKTLYRNMERVGILIQ